MLSLKTILFTKNVSFVLDAKVINRVVAVRTKIGYTQNIETKNPAIFTDGRVNFYIIRKCKTIIFFMKIFKKYEKHISSEWLSDSDRDVL